MRNVVQTGLAVVTCEGSQDAIHWGLSFVRPSTLRVLSEAGSVYGLFKSDLPFRPNHYISLYVGETADLKERLLEHYKNPSTPGVTHFFAESIATEQQRKLRKNELIAEFNPSGNQTKDAADERSI